MDTGISRPGTERFDHRNQSVEFCQLMVSRLKDFLLVLRPLLGYKVQSIPQGKHGAQVWEESILVQGIVDESTLRLAWASKLLSHDRESESNF